MSFEDCNYLRMRSASFTTNANHQHLVELQSLDTDLRERSEHWMTLSTTPSPADLRDWLLDWANQYPVDEDDSVMIFARSGLQKLDADDLRVILRWKIQANHFATANRALENLERTDSRTIESSTAAAFAAEGDAEALQALRGLPQAKTPSSVAVASCLLMCLNPDRWTVMDRRAMTLLSRGSTCRSSRTMFTARSFNSWGYR